MRNRDVLLHHPYDSFSTSVQAFLEEAADDPNVLAIKQTLYRTSGDSPIVHALINAAEAGKQVLVLVEIKARFDEQANITLGAQARAGRLPRRLRRRRAQDAQQAQHGRAPGRGRRAASLHPHRHWQLPPEDRPTLRRPRAAHHRAPPSATTVSKLFNVLTGYSLNTDYQRLLVAPHSVRTGLIERIDREIDNHRQGRPATHPLQGELDRRRAHHRRALPRLAGRRPGRRARSAASARIKAGVPGLSENIRVRSILGRFLEHSRIYWFENDGEPDVWIGSADLMHRNLDRRVEALVQHHRRSTTSPHSARLLDLVLRPRHRVVAPHAGRRVAEGRASDADGEPLADLQAELISLQASSPAAHPTVDDVTPYDPTVREVERKLTVPASFDLDDVTTCPSPRCGEVTHERRRNLTAVYYDTDDFRLARSRVTLRRRTGGNDSGWHLKLPAGDRRLRCPRGGRAAAVGRTPRPSAERAGLTGRRTHRRPAAAATGHPADQADAVRRARRRDGDPASRSSTTWSPSPKARRRARRTARSRSRCWHAAELLEPVVARADRRRCRALGVAEQGHPGARRRRPACPRSIEIGDRPRPKDTAADAVALPRPHAGGRDRQAGPAHPPAPARLRAPVPRRRPAPAQRPAGIRSARRRRVGTATAHRARLDRLRAQPVTRPRGARSAAGRGGARTSPGGSTVQPRWSSSSGTSTPSSPRPKRRSRLPWPRRATAS